MKAKTKRADATTFERGIKILIKVIVAMFVALFCLAWYAMDRISDNMNGKSSSALNTVLRSSNAAPQPIHKFIRTDGAKYACLLEAYQGPTTVGDESKGKEFTRLVTAHGIRGPSSEYSVSVITFGESGIVERLRFDDLISGRKIFSEKSINGRSAVQCAPVSNAYFEKFDSLDGKHQAIGLTRIEQAPR